MPRLCGIFIRIQLNRRDNSESTSALCGIDILNVPLDLNGHRSLRGYEYVKCIVSTEACMRYFVSRAYIPRQTHSHDLRTAAYSRIKLFGPVCSAVALSLRFSVNQWCSGLALLCVMTSRTVIHCVTEISVYTTSENVDKLVFLPLY